MSFPIDDQSAEPDVDDFVDFFCEETAALTEPCEEIKENVATVNLLHRHVEDDYAIRAAQIEDQRGLSGAGKCTVKLTIDVGGLSEGIRMAWEIPEVCTITLAFKEVDKVAFRRARVRPRIMVYKGYDTDASVFLAGTALKNMAFNKLEESYTVEETTLETDPEYFLRLYEFISSHVATLSDFCFICSESLPRPGFLISLCDKDLCSYQYNELDMFADSSLVPRISPQVFAFNLFAFLSAIKSDREKETLQPRPTIRNRSAFFKDLSKMDDKQNPIIRYDFENLQDQEQMEIAWKALERRLPCPSQLLSSPADYGAFRMEYKELARLLEWLIVSNTAYIAHLTEATKIQQFPTPHQFIFANDSTTKSNEFLELVAQHGGKTKLFFHGSPVENWHSIIRRGLKCNGARNGPGISLNERLSDANKNAIASTVQREACGGQCCFSSVGYRVVAVVEVVDTEEAFAHRSNGFAVVNDEKWCTIRMILVFPSSTDKETSLKENSDTVLSEIENIRQELFFEDLTSC